MNKMSDDLISRKALLKELREITDEPHSIMFLMGIGVAISVIGHAETAFDKEKVIEELRGKYEKSIDIYDVDKKFDPECASKGIADAYKTALEIVEKGGIE